MTQSITIAALWDYNELTTYQLETLDGKIKVTWDETDIKTITLSIPMQEAGITNRPLEKLVRAAETARTFQACEHEGFEFWKYEYASDWSYALAKKEYNEARVRLNALLEAFDQKVNGQGIETIISILRTIQENAQR